MPLQNRVDPFGRIHAVSDRGMFTGNRGIIHDPDRRVLLKRRWTTTSWIICTCRYGNVRRQVMGRNGRGGGAGWTELFFLDEVTALAAGHRPCFFCRRAAARNYAGCVGEAFGVTAARAAAIDVRLHRERLASAGVLVGIAGGELGGLPQGAMIAVDGVPYALRRGRALRWRFGGYGDHDSVDALADDHAHILTPATTLAALAAGYQPVWHPSAHG